MTHAAPLTDKNGTSLPHGKTFGDATSTEDAPRLERFIELSVLQQLVDQMADEFDVGMGVIGLAHDPTRSDSLYPILEKAHFSTFCMTVRTSIQGREACQTSDRCCADCAVLNNTPPPCHAGLLDLAVPVRIDTRVVAFLYAGQIRHRDITVQQMRDLKTLFSSYAIADTSAQSDCPTATYEEFLHQYLSVRRKTPEQINTLQLRLKALATAIESIARYSYYLSYLQKTGEQLVPVRDLDTAAPVLSEIIQKTFSRSPSFHPTASYSVWRIRRTGARRQLQAVLGSWPDGDGHDHFSRGMLLDIPAPSWGEDAPPCETLHPLLRPLTAAHQQLLLSSRRAIQSTLTSGPLLGQEYLATLGSFIAVSITSEDTPLGVIQLGGTLEAAITPSEATLLHALAGIIASLFRRLDEFQTLASLGSAGTRSEATRFILDKVTELTLAQDGMVFFWQGDEPHRLLRPAYADALIASDPSGRKDYTPGEGLTGWVGHYGLPLTISSRDDTHLRELYETTLKPKLLEMGWPEDELKPPKWKELTREAVSPYHPPHERPILLVPILPLHPDSKRTAPLGVLRVTDKMKSFTADDERVLESLTSIIALCEERDSSRSLFLTSALYNLLPLMQSTVGYAGRLLRKSHPTREDAQKTYDLAEFLDYTFQSLVHHFLPQREVTDAESCDLSDGIRRVLAVYRGASTILHRKEFNCSDKQVRISGCITVKGPQRLFEIALFHVLDNAFKTCETAANIQVGVVCVSDGVAVYVLDDGPGIAQEHLRFLGESLAHFSFETPGFAQGTGVGVCASKKIIEQVFGGRVIYETKVATPPYHKVLALGQNHTVPDGIRESIPFATGTKAYFYFPKTQPNH